MKEIKYQFNLTLKDNTVLKAFESNEISKNTLTIKFLKTDHEKSYIETIFSESNKDNYATIYKTTTAGKAVCSFIDYVKVSSISESVENVSLEVEKEIATNVETVGEDGEATITPTTTTVTEIVDTPTDMVTVTLAYVSPTEQKIKELDEKINPTINVETCTLEELKLYIQKSNSEALEMFLENNPMLHTDGKYYGVAEVDRNEMIQQYVSYNLKKTIDPETEDVIMWHSKGTKCTPMSVTDFATLSLAISNYTEPYYEDMQEIKEAIMQAEDKEAVLAIKIFGQE